VYVEGYETLFVYDAMGLGFPTNGGRDGRQVSVAQSRGELALTGSGLFATTTTLSTETGVGQTYAYDMDGRRVQLMVTIGTSATPDSTTLYTYDNDNRLILMTQSGSAAAKAAKFEYNLDDTIKTLTRYKDTAATDANKVAVSAYGYDLRGRLTSLNHGTAAAPTTFAGFNFGYDSADRMTTYTGTIGTGSATTSTLSYDSDDQLLRSSGGATGTAGSFTYDANGNRTDGSFAVDATKKNNLLATDGTYNYAYDNEGNRTSRTKISDNSVTSYRYDNRNHLTGVTSWSGAANTSTKNWSITYSYDADGHLDKRQLDANGNGSFADSVDTTERYVWDGSDIVTVMSASGGAALTVKQRELVNPFSGETIAEDNTDSNGVVWPTNIIQSKAAHKSATNLSSQVEKNGSDRRFEVAVRDAARIARRNLGGIIPIAATRESRHDSVSAGTFGEP
jgi:hypothetical protein